MTTTVRGRNSRSKTPTRTASVSRSRSKSTGRKSPAKSPARSSSTSRQHKDTPSTLHVLGLDSARALTSHAGEPRRVIGHDPARPWYTVTYDEAPHYLKHNSFVRTGYRVQCTAAQCLRSVLRVHNQTTNIWSHLAGIVLWAAWIVQIARDTADMQRVMFLINALSQLVLFFWSTTFHTFDAHSAETYLALVKCDYTGILVAFSGSLAVFSFYAFACDSTVKWGYFVFFIVAIIPVCAVVLAPRLATPQYRGLRASVFAVTIGSGLIALIHFGQAEIFTHLGTEQARLMWPVLRWCLLSYGAQALLVVIYVSRVPERWFMTRTTDIWIHSHTICHILCLLSSVLWYFGVVEIYKVRSTHYASCLAL